MNKGKKWGLFTEGMSQFLHKMPDIHVGPMPWNLHTENEFSLR